MVRVVTQSLKIVTILLVTAIVVTGSVSFFNYWTDRARSEEIGRPVIVQITEEDDATSVGDKLSDADLINSSFYFQGRMQVDGGSLLPGTYTLRNGMSVADIIEVITIDDAEEEAGSTPQAGEPVEITFIEGERIEQYAAAYEAAGLPGGAEEFIEAASDLASNREQWAFLESVPDGSTLEGYLFPDTYTFPSNTTPVDAVDLMLSRFDERYSEDMRAQTEQRGMTIHQVVTVASIVEKEAAVPEERPTVAAVYLNRLNQGMQLQADPTVQYAVGSPDDWWPLLNGDLLAAAEESPYNTYEIEGLPPGPISNPGLASLQAVLEPDEVDYLFFVATGDGSGTHVFTNNYDDHVENICTYQPESEVCEGASLLPADPVIARRHDTVAA